MGVSTRQLEPADAEGLTRCFERCYGDSYPTKDFYDPGALARMIGSNRLRSVIAVADTGEIVGHTGLTVRHRQARVPEAGNTVVDPAYRGSGVLRELGIALVERCRKDGFAGFMHYPTTAHEVMQKTSLRFGGVETGVMLAYVPAETQYVEVEVDQPAGRLAATVVYQPIGTLTEQDVLLPERYAALLAGLYTSLGAPRGRGATRKPRERSSVGTTYNAKRSLLHLSVDGIGEDLGTLISELPAEQAAATLAHVDLPLGDPGVGPAVDLLVELGFFYCGLLPGFAAGDVLRLQRLNGEAPSSYRPDLANESARRLLDFIKADR